MHSGLIRLLLTLMLVLNPLTGLAPTLAGEGAREGAQQQPLPCHESSSALLSKEQAVQQDKDCGLPCCDEGFCPTLSICYPHTAVAIAPQVHTLGLRCKGRDTIDTFIARVPGRAIPPDLPPPILT